MKILPQKKIASLYLDVISTIYPVNYFENAKTFDVKYYENEESAYQNTKDTKIWGYVSFHKNYSEAFFNLGILSQTELDDETKLQSTTQVKLIKHIKAFAIKCKPVGNSALDSLDFTKLVALMYQVL